MQVKQLLNVLLRDEVVEFVEREVEFRLTGLLRSIPVQEATKPGSETRLIVKQFCSQISIAGISTKLLERVAKSTEIVHGLMQFENLRELSAAVGNIDALVTRSSSCTGEVGDCGAVSAFFEKHTVGAAMLMEAKAKIQASKDALATEGMLKDLRDELQAVTALSTCEHPPCSLLAAEMQRLGKAQPCCSRAQA